MERPMKRSRERYRMTARIYICSECAKYKVACDAEKMCSRVENRIDKWMEEENEQMEN